MQPELSPGPRSQEQYQAPQVESYELSPDASSPETVPSSSPERVAQRSAVELAPQPRQPMQMPVMPQVTVPPAPVVNPASDDTTVLNPSAATDDDVIEKEWVDRAKQVILQTKDNPYAREKAIGELQRDYLAKRYGRQVGASND